MTQSFRNPSGSLHHWKVCVAFKNLLVVRNISLQYNVPTVESSFFNRVLLSFVLRESLVTAIQSFDGASSEEPQSDTRGSTPSLAVTGPGSNGPKRAETFSGFDTKLKPDNINRASSMRAPERPGIGFPSRQVPGAISPVVGSPKVKHKRRASGGVLPFLTKSNSKEDKEQAGTIGRLCTGKPVKSHLGPVDCKTVGFFFKISKEIGKAWRKSRTRPKCATREKKPYF